MAAATSFDICSTIVREVARGAAIANQVSDVKPGICSEIGSARDFLERIGIRHRDRLQPTALDQRSGVGEVGEHEVNLSSNEVGQGLG